MISFLLLPNRYEFCPGKTSGLRRLHLDHPPFVNRTEHDDLPFCPAIRLGGMHLFKTENCLIVSRRNGNAIKTVLTSLPCISARCHGVLKCGDFVRLKKHEERNKRIREAVAGRVRT